MDRGIFACMSGYVTYKGLPARWVNFRDPSQSPQFELPDGTKCNCRQFMKWVCKMKRIEAPKNPSASAISLVLTRRIVFNTEKDIKATPTLQQFLWAARRKAVRAGGVDTSMAQRARKVAENFKELEAISALDDLRGLSSDSGSGQSTSVLSGRTLTMSGPGGAVGSGSDEHAPVDGPAPKRPAEAAEAQAEAEDGAGAAAPPKMRALMLQQMADVLQQALSKTQQALQSDAALDAAVLGEYDRMVDAASGDAKWLADRF